MPTKVQLPKQPRGRPGKKVYSVAELAHLLEVPEWLVAARAALSFFPGAKRIGEGKEWMIPEDGVKLALRSAVEPFYSVGMAAGLLGLSYTYLSRRTQPVTSLSVPLVAGKDLRALLLPIGDGKPLLRIPERELMRLIGGAWR